MRDVRLDAVFDETLDREKTRVWSLVAPRLGEPSAVPRVREDVRPPLAQATPRTTTAGAVPCGPTGRTYALALHRIEA